MQDFSSIMSSSPIAIFVLAILAGGMAVLLFPLLRSILLRLLGGRDLSHRRGILRYLEKRTQVMSHQLQIIDTQSKEYFTTLHESGLSEILGIHDALLEVTGDLQQHLATRNFQLFDSLINFIRHPDAIDSSAQNATAANLTLLIDWQNRADQAILRLIEALSIAQKQSIGLGVKRPNKEMPTAIALRELRDLLKRDD